MKRRVQPPAKLGEFTEFRRWSSFWTTALLGMAALLVTVAVLQYRWTSQITEATETRIGNNVESLMLDWHLDFYQQFSAICVALQVGPDSGAHDDWRAYRERYAHWAHGATHPKMVENLYIWETSQPSAPRLLRIGTWEMQLQHVEPPEKLRQLLGRLKERSASIGEGLEAWEAVRGPQALHGNNPIPARTSPLTGWQFDQNIPAIVHPIIHHSLGPEQGLGKVGAIDWIVIMLNFDAIRHQVLPDVTTKYTAGDQYELSMGLGGGTEGLIYTSETDARSARPAPPDATMNIFGPPPESTEGYFWQVFKNGNSLTGLEWHQFSGPVWFPVFQYGRHQPPWTLTLRKQNGSLLAAIERSRHRNLITEALVLLLLMASMTLVVVATHRAQRLAKLEMEFVASVSHELRTPLSAIFSAGENIADGFIDGKAALKRYGTIITSQATQLIDLVDKVLLFAGTRDGSQHYQWKLLPLQEIIKAVNENIAGLVQERECTVETSLHRDLPYISGDRSALTQCLQNLVTNAIKYSPRNSKVLIAAEADHPGASKREMRIHVRDQGVGISSSELPHIFEPFYRSPAAVSAQIHGTGLGLALAKQLAEAMDGKLSVVSEVGKGSTFTLHLPVPLQPDADAVNAGETQWVEQG
jgi:two-component system sensor histidine kinase SenX3